MVKLAAMWYVGYDHQHLSEVLTDDGINLSRSTVRRILLGARPAKSEEAACAEALVDLAARSG